MKKLVVLILFSYSFLCEAQNYNYNDPYLNHGFWFQQPVQPTINYQYNINNGNFNGYGYNPALEFGRSLGNLLVTVRNNRWHRKQRKRRNRINNNRHNHHHHHNCYN